VNDFLPAVDGGAPGRSPTSGSEIESFRSMRILTTQLFPISVWGVGLGKI